MTTLVQRYRRSAPGPRVAAAAVLVLLLGFMLTRVTWPLAYRTFPVSGTALGVHPDGRVLVLNDHAISVVDATTGAVTGTVALGTLTVGGGIVGRPGTSQALALVTAGESYAVVTVDLDTRSVSSVTSWRDRTMKVGKSEVTRTVGVDSNGHLIAVHANALIASVRVAVGSDGKKWTSDGIGVGGVPDSGPARYDYLSMSPDGRLLYAAGTTRALVIDTATNRIRTDVARTESPTGSGLRTEGAMTLLLAADGNHLFTAGHRDTQVVVRTLAGAAVAVLDAGATVHSIALSPDGDTLYAILSDRMLAIDVGRYS